MESRYLLRDVKPTGAVITLDGPQPHPALFTWETWCRAWFQSAWPTNPAACLFLRVEDTDAKREVPGAVEVLINTLKHYGISFDEGATIDGDMRRLRPLPAAPAGRDLSRLRQGAGATRAMPTPASAPRKS
ncbi:MAG: hypothetical protein ACLU9S_10815 [Oscillospiraceae bacterium]